MKRRNKILAICICLTLVTTTFFIVTAKKPEKDKEYFGEWEEMNYNTSYYAETDGFVSAWIYGNSTPYGGYAGTGWLMGFTDNNETPETMRACAYARNGRSTWESFCMPVRSGDYWTVTFYDAYWSNPEQYYPCETGIYWISLET